MPNEVKLLPCAFCSGEGLMHRAPWGWQVTCCDCGASPRNNSNANHETETGAAAVWNHRPTTVVTDEVVERPSEEALARIGEAAEGAVLSEMSWPEIGEAVLASMPTVVIGER